MESTIERVIQEARGLCYESTSMALECICETLCYEHGLDATFSGRSIYVSDKRVASIRTCVEPCEDCRIVAIYDYKIIG